MMWLNLKEDGTPDVSGVDEAVLLPHRPVQRAAADHPQGDRVRPGARARHDPGRPRGRARPDRAQLQLRPRRAHRRQPLDVPAGVPPGRARAEARSRASCRSRSWASPPTAATTTSRSGAATRTRSCRSGEGQAEAEPDRPLGDRRHPRAPRRPHRGDRLDGELVPPALGHGLLGARLRRLGLPEPHHRAARLGAGPVRVPLGRLGREPVPLDGGADQGDGGRDRAQARPGRSRRSATSTRRWRRARRSRRSR